MPKTLILAELRMEVAFAYDQFTAKFKLTKTQLKHISTVNLEMCDVAFRIILPN